MYQSAINFEYSFNTDIAYVKKCFEDKYKPILIKHKLDSSLISNSEKFFITSFSLDSFDEGYLKPDLLFHFCTELSIRHKIFYDKYYRFVFSKFDKKLIRWREVNNLSQKQAAKLLKISPVTIGNLENNLKYSTRKQYKLINNILKL